MALPPNCCDMIVMAFDLNMVNVRNNGNINSFNICLIILNDLVNLLRMQLQVNSETKYQITYCRISVMVLTVHI